VNAAQQPAARARGRPRSQASEDAILDATLELLSDCGYRDATVEAIALRAGASKSTIYRRWPTKENLVIAAFARSPLLHAPARGDVCAQLSATIAQVARYMQETPLGAVLPVLVAERGRNPALDQALQPLVRQRREPLGEILSGAITRGELPAGIDIELAQDLLMGPVLQRIMVMGKRVDRPFIDAVVSNVCGGLRAAAGS
jgi:AcrR family transcriptional regulator